MTVGVAILGSTGSIGCTALQVLARQRERFRVAALTAHSNADLLQRQSTDWAPAYVGIVNGGKREGLMFTLSRAGGGVGVRFRALGGGPLSTRLMSVLIVVLAVPWAGSRHVARACRA